MTLLSMGNEGKRSRRALRQAISRHLPISPLTPVRPIHHASRPKSVADYLPGVNIFPCSVAPHS